MKKGANILLSLMQLNIGGAETHVVELAKELKRKGFNITVTSNGGVYVKELEEAGIKHYNVPLQNKNPINMLKAASLLKKIIIEEKIDIVHSHARIPSFILGKLHKRMKFPFVTTAHWVFNTGYGLKYITDWGEKTVAVSEDIKTYLMDNYHVPEGDINVTINGIDTDKFSPDTDCSDIKKELGISDGDNVITYVSRLDESRSLVAKQLIEVVPELDKAIDNLKIIVVGAGDDFNNVKAAADKVNAEIGRDVIALTGARTDINKLIAPCKLFVGVSRAALEAMAAQKPVIIAGNEGYIGLFDDSKLTVGIDTNFCCRGCEQSTGEIIKRDILKFFAMSGGEQLKLGEYGRELIKREYSVSRIADDCIRVYDWALDKNKEILISGYYGFKNSGDDALLKAIIQDLKKHKESPNIVVLSANPRETETDYRVKSISRINVFSIFKHMKKADMLISGGGTLIQDRTSTKSLWYYLTIISLALRNNLKVMLYSNGIGPLEKKRNIARTRKILDKVDLITLRDEHSYKTLREIGVTNERVKVTADPALDLDIADEKRGRAILADEGVPKGSKLLGVSVRRWQDIGADFEDAVARVCDYAYEKYGFYTVLLPMQSSRDTAILQNIKRKMKNKSSIIKKRYMVEDMISLMKCFDLCIGMRLHTLIYAAINAVPLIGLVYDPKISSFMEHTRQKYYLDVKNLNEDKLKAMLDECVRDYDKIKSDLKDNYTVLKAQSQLNGKYAVELYEKGSVAL
ncbi:MAG: polysaccharide pyruvyl transferase CsaB [Oscillospiraceae bacterium]|nr:polysaccharide pyruvyl transferase CsaB [Oscillospiraceae bacterium]